MHKSQWVWHGETLTLGAQSEGKGWKITLPDGSTHTLTEATVGEGNRLTLRDAQHGWTVAYYLSPSEVQILYRGRLYRFQRPRPVGSAPAHGSAEGVLTAPMPGLVTKVLVQVGDRVEAGQRLLVLEAMKMEQALFAPFDGIVHQLNAQEGDIVQEGTILVEIVEASTSEGTDA